MHPAIKATILSVLRSTGYFDLKRRLQKDRISILMYHRFTGELARFKLSQSVFERQIIILKKQYNFISLNQYLNVLEGKDISLPDNPIIITIDDGYQDNYEYAFPILQKYNVPATIFLTTDFISKRIWLWQDEINYILNHTSKDKLKYKHNDFEKVFDFTTEAERHRAQLSLHGHFISIDNEIRKELMIELAELLCVDVPKQVVSEYQPLTWDQIREMNKFGIDFGSHTCTHPICSRLNDVSLAYELVESKKEIENQLNIDVSAFCYPNGQPQDLNSTVVEKVRNAGYRGAVTASYGFNQSSTDCFYLKRIPYLGNDSKTILRELTRK